MPQSQTGTSENINELQDLKNFLTKGPAYSEIFKLYSSGHKYKIIIHTPSTKILALIDDNFVRLNINYPDQVHRNEIKKFSRRIGRNFIRIDLPNERIEKMFRNAQITNYANWKIDTSAQITADESIEQIVSSGTYHIMDGMRYFYPATSNLYFR